jgi:26S proteasome regulatory subunit N12
VFSYARRDEIARYSEKGYDSLYVSDEKQMLMFISDQDLHD